MTIDSLRRSVPGAAMALVLLGTAVLPGACSGGGRNKAGLAAYEARTPAPNPSISLDQAAAMEAGGTTALTAESGAQQAGVTAAQFWAASDGGQASFTGPAAMNIYGEVDSPRTKPLPDYDGAENLAQITFAPDGSDFDPDVSRDGKLIVYASTQHRATPDIYIKGVKSHTLTQLTADAASDVMPVFSPDGKRVAFISDRAGSWDVYVMGVGGGQPVQLTDDSGQELHPTWSSDGQKIAYCRLGGPGDRWELWVVNVANTAVRQFLGYGLFPRWSPADDRILFQRSRERGDRLFSVWTINYVNGEGLNPTEIVSSAVAAIVNPAWSPDGTRIAFATIPIPLQEIGERPRAADLWIVSADGTGRANLTGGRFVNLMPTWGGDGRIYFVSDRGGRDNIWSLIPEQAIFAAMGPGASSNMAGASAEDHGSSHGRDGR